MERKDINVRIDDFILNVRAVAIIIKNNKVLLQKRKYDKYWALPGGKVKIGEKSEDTIKRELFEEIGVNNCEILKLDGMAEYFFKYDGDNFHQYIFSYLVKVEDDIFNNEKFEGIEKDEDLIYEWFDINKIENVPVKPDFLIEQLNNIDNSSVKFVSYKE